jgi:hypothetical protein
MNSLKRRLRKMAEKLLKARVAHKIELEVDWLKSSYIPLEGEIVVYKPDATHPYPRTKIGDGVTKVSLLPFVLPSRATKLLDSTVAYTKDVPEGALPYAELSKLGGMTRKCTNLIPYPYKESTKTTGGVTFTDNGDGSIAINGTATGNKYITLFDSKTEMPKGFEVGKSYRIMKSNTTSYLVCNVYVNGKEESWLTSKATTATTAVMPDGVTGLSIYIILLNGETANNEIIYPMVNEGTTALPYEPYYEGLRDTAVTEIKSVGANLIPYPYVSTTTTINGVTFTDNGDGSITVNGTANVSCLFTLAKNLKLSGLYALSGCPVGGKTGGYSIQSKVDNVWVNVNYDTGSGTTVNVVEEITDLIIHISEGTTVSNKTFYPMLNKGSTALPYAPYVEHTLPISAEVRPAHGINNEVYDYLDFGEQESVKRVGVVDMGTLDWSIKETGSAYAPYFYSHVSDIKYFGNFYTVTPVILSSLFTTTTRSLDSFIDKCVTVDGVDGVVQQVQIKYADYTDAASFKAAMSGVMLYYELDTPEVTDITDLITVDNVINVESCGAITPVNEYNYAVPSEITYYTSDNVSEIIGAKTVVGDLVGTAQRAISDENGNIISKSYLPGNTINTIAEGQAAVAIGIGTTAEGAAQLVQGKYNVVDSSYAHIVGNGSSGTDRSNAYTLDWSGNASFAGDVKSNNKKLATEEYVKSEIEGLVDTAPEALNTLNELAEALGEDPNFATTVMTEIGKKANDADLATVAKSGNFDDLLNKPITTGKGDHSMIFAEGSADGDYSIAGGTDDKSLITELLGSLGNLATLEVPKAQGDLSLAFGINNVSSSTGSATVGVLDKAGVSGYYWHDFNLTNNTITISKTRKTSTTSSASAPSSIDWEVGDYLFIVTDETRYAACSKITKISGNTITVDKLPSDMKDYSNVLSIYTYKSPDDRGIFAVAIDNFDPNDNNTSLPTKSSYTPRTGAVDFGFGAFVLGGMNVATGILSTATGFNNLAGGPFSHAEGRDNITGYNAHAEGQGNKALSFASHAEGGKTEARGPYAHSEGQGAKALANTSHAEGYYTVASNLIAHAEGKNTTSSGYASHSEGGSTNLYEEGKEWTADAPYALASGDYAHTEGLDNRASGVTAHAEGHTTNASGIAAHTEGVRTNAIGNAAHAEGIETKAYGRYSHAEGYGTEVNGESSHVEGQQNTILSGLAVHVEGSNNTHTIGDNTHVGGSNNTSEGSDSLIFGQGITYKGDQGFAIGTGHFVNGQYNAVGGIYCEVGTDERTVSYSTVMGLNLKSTAHGQTIFGYYNNANAGDAFQLGRGSSTQRKNIFTVNNSGTGWFADTIKVGGTGYSDAKVVATLDDISWNNIKGTPAHINVSNSIKLGSNNTIEGTESYIGGVNNTIKASRALVQGTNNSTYGDSSESLIVGKDNKVNGKWSIVTGIANELGTSTQYNNYCNVLGLGLRAISHGQTVIGQYNAPNALDVFQIGYGDSSKRANIFTVSNTGNGTFAGSVKCTGIQIGDTIITEDILKKLINNSNLVSAEEVPF